MDSAVKPARDVEISQPVMNKWQQLESCLAGVFGSACFTAAGHEVYCVKHPCGERLVVVVYVNGWIKGEWGQVGEDGTPAHPEARFWFPVKRRLWPLREHARLKRAFGKKKADAMTALRVIAYLPTWNSPRALVRHLQRHFPDLELKATEELA